MPAGMPALAPLLAAVAQAASFVATLDVFPAAVIPRNVRGVLVVVLIPLLLERRRAHAESHVPIVHDVINATLIGASFGLSASIVAAAARAAGSIIDNAFAGGLFGQGIFAGAGPMSRLYSISFVVVFLGGGAFDRLIASFVSASDALHELHYAHGGALLARACMHAALGLAGPMLLVQTIATLISGAITRVVPHVNGILLNAPLSSLLTLLCIAVSGAAFWPALLALSEKVAAAGSALLR
jgi:type III secretory pathway component EscT